MSRDRVFPLTIAITRHDDHPKDEAAIVDQGLGDYNDEAAPLHEVRYLSCFARTDSGKVIGGAVGRWWGEACELQQLWVEAAERKKGLGTRLIQDFEAHARSHGCTSVYLETFSFQALHLYRLLGYEVEYERGGYPHGILKYHMVKRLGRETK